MDSDTELTFFADHTVHMFEWGFGLSGYLGTYRVESGDRIVARFKSFGEDWPEMIAYREDDALLLRPSDTSRNFVMGNRGGATIPGGRGSYWPFRMLTGEEEKKVLEMIKEEAKQPRE